MHKRFDPIREHLRNTYSVPGDVLDAIMADTLRMAKDLPELRLVATIRHTECDGAGYYKGYFEPAEDFDPEEFKDGDTLVLESEKVIGTLKVTRDNKGIISKIESDMDAELDTFREGTQVFVLR